MEQIIKSKELPDNPRERANCCSYLCFWYVLHEFQVITIFTEIFFSLCFCDEIIFFPQTFFIQNLNKISYFSNKNLFLCYHFQQICVQLDFPSFWQC